MKRLLPLLLFWLPLAAVAEVEFPLTEDSKPHDHVPKGEVLKFQLEGSNTFPGTTREVSVYVPKQYDGTKPACVYVNQDGVQWNAPVVFDNLIEKGEIPVLIGVFIKPGVVKPIDEKTALPRFNRSFEYDGLGPDYSKFVLEEVLPEVEKLRTTDGRRLLLSKRGNDRAIGGSSSGAICAFTAAWERPDAFSRVFSVVNTMVGLRGANEYQTLIRKYEPKRLRIFQQDGSNDLNIYCGDWWMANQELERSLTFAGYEHEHVWGEGGHNGKHGTAVFPDAMRYLWKGWPEPVRGTPSNNNMLKEILLPDEGWRVAWQGKTALTRLSSNELGEVFFEDADKAYKVGLDGKVAAIGTSDHHAAASGGRVYGMVPREHKITFREGDAKPKTFAEGLRGSALVALNNGNVYVAETVPMYGVENSVWLVRADGTKQKVEQAKSTWGGICTSPDQSLLYLSDARSHWVYSYQIQPDGTLAHKQRYYWLHTPDSADDSGAAGMKVDAGGRLYVASRMGLQVCDQAGRVNAILPTPDVYATDLAFGGESLSTVYVLSGGVVFKRKLNVQGAHNGGAPVKPAPPRL